MPLPSAWKVEDRMMLMPASRKWKQMMRRAGLPMASSGLAGGEQAQQLVGQELEQQEADQHDHLSIEHGAL